MALSSTEPDQTEHGYEHPHCEEEIVASNDPTNSLNVYGVDSEQQRTRPGHSSICLHRDQQTVKQEHNQCMHGHIGHVIHRGFTTAELSVQDQ